ncbi:PRC-barrel domain-containing protein [Bosea minatitlanensis]|uniref:PRC-barrel domain-containing protein n=1 Tax=Bosea minatitlanensis TaxID=128782 RepID=A0ABW0FAB6_9HYPH|nr:PRC-barrel domain-containing protein [Bosea minatitlanensis]MCT4495803.1 PRC-barrel domain-containing protein [Bosea minatitlanensis]
MRNAIIAIASAMILSTSAYAQTATSTTAVKEVYVAAKPTDVLSSNLIGLNIHNGAKDKIGEIKDIVISNGQLAGYIVSVGGFLGIGEHYVVVSPGAVKVNYSENDKKWSALMETTKDALKAAPQFKYEGRWAK